jgi:hypothetical protein
VGHGIPSEPIVRVRNERKALSEFVVTSPQNTRCGVPGPTVVIEDISRQSDAAAVRGPGGESIVLSYLCAHCLGEKSSQTILLLGSRSIFEC